MKPTERDELIEYLERMLERLSDEGGEPMDHDDHDDDDDAC
jgi:hypothetical protein